MWRPREQQGKAPKHLGHGGLGDQNGKKFGTLNPSCMWKKEESLSPGVLGFQLPWDSFGVVPCGSLGWCERERERRELDFERKRVVLIPFTLMLYGVLIYIQTAILNQIGIENINQTITQTTTNG